VNPQLDKGGEGLKMGFNTGWPRLVLALFAGLAVCSGGQLVLEEPASPGGGGATTLSVPGTVFTFTSPGGFPPCTSGGTDISQCQFLNSSGQTWMSLLISINPGTEPVDSCFALYGFAPGCLQRQGSSSTPSLLYFSGGTGIRAGEILAFSGSGWPTSTLFTLTANTPFPPLVPVPEPDTLALAIAGFALVAGLRWRRGQV